MLQNLATAPVGPLPPPLLKESSGPQYRATSDECHRTTVRPSAFRLQYCRYVCSQPRADLGSTTVKNLTVRITDDLHAKARKAAGAESLSAFAREALAEKIGRSELGEEVARLRERVDRLERLLSSRQP